MRVPALCTVIAIAAAACGGGGAVPGNVAPSNLTVVSETDQALTAQEIFVLNNSSVPIVVTSVSLKDCQNIQEACVPQPLHIVIAPHNRRRIATATAAAPGYAYMYRYSWTWTADTPPVIRSPDPQRPGVVRVDSIAGREVVTPAMIARLRAAGTRADTIVAMPDTVEIHVGDNTHPASLVHVTALDATGQQVTPFIPTFIMPQSPLYSFTGGVFHAAAAGEVVFFVEAFPRMDSEPRGHPSTAIVFRILP